ncbi:hypothetical protein BLA23254_03848 [Burkholderia lata]|uniref:DUF4145 domain-containing protein n=1 Tax=Burkholderia lata (strain ATCC 17760 / DSM 23089 / LMG 22485 / NCIMB 9086 / R18194 / 383) TaxID=482957 RepID=A0A6P2MS66_BURL3|nr:hypothetical protein [Burkholderia lata]VWB81622.1 hypothetical protein BLA23254_03848 [Burkholderia lata]
MPSFDFITLKEFRLSLERDYSEMTNCLQAQAWKSVQVIAGSIVESLLIDYLLSTSNPGRSGKDPLRIDLAEAIAICRKETVLTDRTADLCSVIRSYRNLIHPGRVVRMGEPEPDRSSATIATTLVDMIADELAKTRRQSVGLTAEQIVSKVRRDSNSSTIVKHLILEASEHQRERLLLELIPDAYMSRLDDSDCFDDEPERLQIAFRVTLENVSDEIRERVVSEFVRILREEDGDYVDKYCTGFFLAPDIRYVARQYEPLVREFLLGRAARTHTHETLRLLKGITPYLELSDVEKWLDPYVRTIASNQTDVTLKSKAKDQFAFEFIETKRAFDEAVTKRLDAWHRTFVEANYTDRASTVEEMKNLVDIPF